MFNCTAFHTMYAVLAAGLICTTSSVKKHITAGIFVRNVLQLACLFY